MTTTGVIREDTRSLDSGSCRYKELMGVSSGIIFVALSLGHFEGCMGFRFW